MTTTDQTPANQPCDACGCSAEMGFIIKEGDDVATVFVKADDANVRQSRFNDYLALAKEVNPKVVHQVNEEGSELEGRLQFECSAEKLIFELKSRSLN